MMVINILLEDQWYKPKWSLAGRQKETYARAAMHIIS